MQFKRLELFGFKSFAERTVIEIQAGVTAIVGPNGCGKSNVSDSIRWVLGEQSAKSLRGGSMEDVIFGGSSAREAVNFAEVSLTLSNEDRSLNIDYDEVVISRRLYRSGESEYLLNKNVVRLKDIHELLMGTGIGTDGYSLIEQGRMDSVLGAKPEDRREIFEEAAGITKFKSKKVEALRKLESTDANLLRVNDIIQEVKRQIGSVERQAKKAEQYKSEFEKLKRLEISMAAREFVVFETRRKTQEEELAALKERETEFAATLSGVEERCRAERESLTALDGAIRQCETEEAQAAADIRRNQDRVLLNRERVGELVERRENLLRQIETARRRAEEMRAEHAKLGEEFEATRREEEEARTFLDGVESRFAAIEDDLRRAAAGENAARESLAALGGKKSDLATELAKLEAQSAMYRAHAQTLEERRQGLASEEADLLKILDRPLSDAEIEERSRTLWLEPKIREFKEKLMAAAGDAQRLDAVILEYTDDILKTQGQLTENRVRLQEAEGRRRRVEQELGAVRAELDEVERGQAGVAERQSGLSTDLAGLSAEETGLAGSLAAAQTSLRERAAEKEALLVRLAETRSKQEHLTSRREKIEKDRAWVLEAAANEEASLAAIERETAETASKRETIEGESAALESEIEGMILRRDEALLKAEGVRHDRGRVSQILETLEAEREEKAVFLREARDRSHAFELESSEIRHEIDRIKERIFNAYQVDLAIERLKAETDEAAAQWFGTSDDVDPERAKAEIQALRDKLAKMGPVNLVAIEEYEEMKQRYEFLVQQEQDLVKAKEDLKTAIQKINRTTKELFVETFEKTRLHFTEYYRLLFGGGTADLVLLDENDVLESGIEIVARPPGKKMQSITLLSGGEKALTSVALLFALFKVKPSPFCVLDEIDAPLDETNVDRFCSVLKDFIQGSQFLLITHNKRTMNLADALYGVTMAQTGVSSVVSVRFAERAELVGNGNGNGNGNGHGNSLRITKKGPVETGNSEN